MHLRRQKKQRLCRASQASISSISDTESEENVSILSQVTPPPTNPDRLPRRKQPTNTKNSGSRLGQRYPNIPPLPSQPHIIPHRSLPNNDNKNDNSDRHLSSSDTQVTPPPSRNISRQRSTRTPTQSELQAARRESNRRKCL